MECKEEKASLEGDPTINEGLRRAPRNASNRPGQGAMEPTRTFRRGNRLVQVQGLQKLQPKL